MAISSFRGKHGFLSNFFTEPDGSCVENEFQALKADDLAEMLFILISETPGLAKRRGRQVKLISNWEEIKVQAMAFLVLKKFTDHPGLREALLATGDEELIEGNTWGDTFWGVCDGVGQNALGEILMAVRSLLR